MLTKKRLGVRRAYLLWRCEEVDLIVLKLRGQSDELGSK